MATSRSFGDMINDYLQLDLLRSEIKRMFLLDNVKKDNNWVGGGDANHGYVVPFLGGHASSVSFGSLPASNDIAEDQPIRGIKQDQPEVWGSMKFNDKDFMQHNGKKREISLIGSIQRQIDPFMTFVQTAISDVLIGGPHFATVTDVTNANIGVIGITDIRKVTRKQKILFREAATPSVVAGYIQSVDKNAGTILVHTTRAGGTPLDLTVAGPLTAALLVGDRLYYDGLVNLATGAIQNNFSNIRNILLSAANGGDATIYGQTKTSYQFLQSLNINGAAITQSNIIEQLFLNYSTEVEDKCLGINGKIANEFWLSPRNYAWVMLGLEAYKGQYFTTPGKKNAEAYAWKSVTIGAGSGQEIKVVRVPELSNDIIPVVNWDSLLLASNGYFKFKEDPEKPGKIHYFEERAATGYTYIVDIAFMGDLINIAPESNAIIYGIS